MGENIKLQKETADYAAKFKQQLPAVLTAHHAFRDVVYQDGALSFKTKHLMALAAAMRAGGINCSISHTKIAVEAGATVDEVMETIGVALMLGGTPVMGISMRVIQTLEEMGKL